MQLSQALAKKINLNSNTVPTASQPRLASEERAMEFDEEVPLAEALKRIRKESSRKRKAHTPPTKPADVAHNTEPVQLLPTAADARRGIAVSEFDYSIENHFKDVDKIAKLCGYPKTLDAVRSEIKRFSDSVTFLREWRDFNYAPRVVRFASQHNSEEKDVTSVVTLPQFSSVSVPKKERQNGSKSSAESSKDFIMNVGGSVWALDWCPRVDLTSENQIRSEFVAVAAHPPDSSYHKVGAPLTGRGAIQIWCLLTVHVREDIPSLGNKISKKKVTLKSHDPTIVKRQRGRPRKKPLDNSVGNMDTDSQYVQPLAVEYPVGSSTLHSSDRTSVSTSKPVLSEDSGRTHTNSSQTEDENVLLLTTPEVRGNKAKAGKKDLVCKNNWPILRQCEHQESSLVSPLASASCSVDSTGPGMNVTCIGSCDANTSDCLISKDVELPRIMLCLAHNGKVAWDLKWRPVNGYGPVSMNKMGYLAVLLGSGALEVWEVPLPHTVKLIFPSGQECLDPRFIKLKPVFRCSMLKCGGRQSIPLTVEWSVSSQNDMILAGCHDGLVAVWRFSITDSSTETRPLLSFIADTGPIRTLAWAPCQSDLESANIIVTAGHKGFKFWDIRDPFRPLWDPPSIQGVTYCLDWLRDPRCIFGSIDDGTLWLINLQRAAHDVPIVGKSLHPTTKHGLHSFNCSSYAIWSIQASRLTGMVAYCGEEGTTICFQPTTRSVKDPSRNRPRHYICGALVEEKSTIVIASSSTHGHFKDGAPSMKRSGAAKDQEKRAKERMVKSQTNKEQPLAICWGTQPVDEHGSGNPMPMTKEQTPESKQSSVTDDFEVFPPKIVAMHRVRWNVNKGSEKWLCYGGAAGLVRCQEVDLSIFE